MASGNREAFRSKLQERTNTNVSERKYGGVGFRAPKTYFRKDLELRIWMPKSGEYFADIIPYRAGHLDPVNKEGDPSYVLELHVHGRIGTEQVPIICPRRNWQKKCPICEYVYKLRQNNPKDPDIKSLDTRVRCVYNVVVRDGGDEDRKGVQIFDVAFHLFEKQLREKAQIPTQLGGGTIFFTDPDDGKVIYFKKKEAPPPQYVEFSPPEFYPRQGYNITDEILNSTYTLDQVIEILTYEQIEKIFYGENVSDAGAPHPPPTADAGVGRLGERLPRPTAVPEPDHELPPPPPEDPSDPGPVYDQGEAGPGPLEPEPQPHPAQQAPTPPRPPIPPHPVVPTPPRPAAPVAAASPPPPPRPVPPAPARPAAPAAPAPARPGPAAPTAAPPAMRPIQQIRRPVAPTAPAPAAAPAQQSKPGVCPIPNGTFGVSTDKLPQCGQCLIWESCAQEARRIEAATPGSTPLRRGQ